MAGSNRRLQSWQPREEQLLVVVAMEQYVLLDPRQRALYRDVMQESYETLMALEFPLSKPDLLSRLERSHEARALDFQEPTAIPPAVSENTEEKLHPEQEDSTAEELTGVASKDSEALPEEAPPSKCTDCGKRVNHITHPHRFRHKSTQTPIEHEDEEGAKNEVTEKEHPHRCADPTSLAKHQLSHAGGKPHQGLDCDKRFGRSSHLDAHFQSHTEEKPYECKDCGRGSRLGRHQQIHIGACPHGYRECSKTVPLEATLATHRRLHDVEAKPHQCPECGRGFSAASVLERHCRLHRGKKPYQCNICGKGFAWSSHFDRHRVSHTGEKPFPCAYCGKCFGRSSHRNRHQRSHAVPEGQVQPQDNLEGALPTAPVANWWEGDGDRRPSLEQQETWPVTMDPAVPFQWMAKSSGDAWRTMRGNDPGPEAENLTHPAESWTQPPPPVSSPNLT
uniref:Uncharacterized protein n=1 Tax=Sphaerodactylus townsendi TaxID=933632 RepID=A0ACB8EGX6_9SAUR